MTKDDKARIIATVGIFRAASLGVFDDEPPAKTTNTLTKNLFGRFKTAATVGPTTFNMTTEVEADFTGVRIAIPNLHTAAIAGVRVSVAATTDNYAEDYATNINPVGGGAWVDATFNDANSGTLPAALGTDRPSWTYTDTIAVSSLKRNTSAQTRTKPLLLVRIEYPDGAVITTPYNDLYYWRTNGAWPTLRVAKQSVLGVTNKSSFTVFNTSDEAVVVPAFEYTVAVKGRQVMLAGDSTSAGQGSNVRDYGAVQRACQQLSTQQAPIEYFNCAKLGLTPRAYAQGAVDVLNQVHPTVLFYQPCSVNDITAGGITPGQTASVYAYLGQVDTQLRLKGINPDVFYVETPPCNPSFRDTGANDSKRVAINASLKQLLTGKIVEGYAAAVSGPVNAQGQTTIKPEFDSGDGVHFNDAGYNALVPTVVKMLK